MNPTFDIANSSSGVIINDTLPVVGIPVVVPAIREYWMAPAGLRMFQLGYPAATSWGTRKYSQRIPSANRHAGCVSRISARGMPGRAESETPGCASQNTWRPDRALDQRGVEPRPIRPGVV
jgi:hypothetical protein